MTAEINAPKISVVMGVVSVTSSLDESIESVLNQSFKDFEFIIVDDSGTGVVSNYVERFDDDRIRVIVNESNQGLGYSLSLAVEQANSNLIARLDADDYAKPNRLERQLQEMTSDPEIDILGSWAEERDDNGDTIGIRAMPTEPEQVARLVWANPLIHPSVMFRRDRILAIGSYKKIQRRKQDYDLWFRAVAAGYKLKNIPEPLISYFVGSNPARSGLYPALTHAKIGLIGCWSVKAPPYAYLAVLVPSVQYLLPAFAQNWAKIAKNKLDPRK
jgi:glycosyltransferase involved in cell wall biosynthesis